MSTTLRVIVDHVIAPEPGAAGRYTMSLTEALIETAPPGCEVEGVVSNSLPRDYQRVEELFPGMAGLYKSSLARRELAAAWQFGLTTSPGGGMIHAPSLFAPLRRHDRSVPGEQVVVTVHDVLAWTHPEALTPARVAWQKAMLKRARRFADAVVVPTHALADRLSGIIDLGDRVRVIGTAPRSGLVMPADAAAEARRLGLPTDYLVVEGSLEPRHGVLDLLEALGRPGVPEIPLVLIGPPRWGELHLAAVAEDSGVPSNRVISVEPRNASEHAVVLGGATAVVVPRHEDGDGTSLIEAFSLGVPVVHSDVPAYVEIAAGAGISVPVGVGGGYVDRLAAAVTAVVEQRDVAERLAIAGGDRARAFSWSESAASVWELHAEL